MRGALLVGGTSSDAGKSLIVAGLCRLLARDGVRVAPFKAQNMSNNSAVTVDGGEIGRAQALQAYAAGLEPSTRFNPVLLKPGSDRRSHVLVRGRPAGDVGARDYQERKRELAGVVESELAALRDDFDVVIVEGAGSVAEINLRAGDLANMGLARAAGLPVVVVADIDRGGSLASLFGTTAILDADDQALVAGYLINKFRGDPSILRPGLDRLQQLTGRHTLGVLPFADDLWIDAEDSLAVPVGRRVGPRGADGVRGPRLTVAAIRLPRVSNTTDVEALACEPGVDVTWVDDAASVRLADLAVVPGTRATVGDLDWMRARGIDEALAERARRGAPVLGICGGFQMLATQIDDPVESGAGIVPGLGLFDMRIVFDTDKTVRQVSGLGAGQPIRGYEIHHGRVTDSAETPWIVDDVYGAEGAAREAVFGTHWHGLMASDAFRREFLRTVAGLAGVSGFTVSAHTVVDDVRRAQVDAIADLLAASVDVDALTGIIERGADPALPTIVHELR